MRTARALILSVVSSILGFACTGEDASSDGKSGTETGGGTGGTAATTGGSGGAAASSGSSSAGGGTGGSGPSGGTGGSAAGASGGDAGMSGGGGTSNGGTGATGAGSGGAGASNGGAGASSGGAAAGSGGAAAGSGGAGGNGGAASGAGGGGGSPVVPSLLVFSRTNGYRHESIPDGIAALRTIAQSRGWELVASEDPTLFSDSGLAPFTVLVFLSTLGDIFTPEQKAAFERYIRPGHGYVGIHSASDTEFEWPFYGEVVGAFFREHPDVQPALIHVETSAHPSTATLPRDWRRTDEWYSFRTNPRPNVTVLLTLDETSYSPGTSAMGADHPIAWYHVYQGARSFYTALGHTRESYTEAAFLAHITGGIEWAAGR